MLQSGDNLIIQIFFWTSAVLCGVETVKASGWRIWAFGLIGSILALAGLTWGILKDLSPPLTRWVADVATAPQSWFVLIVLGLVLLSVTGRKARKDGSGSGDGSPNFTAQIEDIDQRINEIWHNIGSIEGKLDLLQNYDDNDLRRLINDIIQKQALLEVQFKQALPTAEQTDNLDRTAFLLSTAAVDIQYRQKLEEALAHLPAPSVDTPIDTDEKMMRETERLNGYFEDVGANLSGSRWANEFMSVIRRAENEADSDLLRMEVPHGLHPARFRLFHIARMCRDRVETFLNRSIIAAKEQERQMLQMLRERPQLHTRR
jgi:hypothetical protein